MFIVHVIPYSRGKVSCFEDVVRSEVYRVKDDVLVGFIDNIVDKKHYISIRPAFPEDEYINCWKLIE